MATFRHVVLQQPDLAAIVFGYQFGVWEDVRPALFACKYLAAFDETSRCGGKHQLDASFYPTFTGTTEWTTRPISGESHELSRFARDDRLPLHVAIVEGQLELALRLLRYRPDLASEDAILLALKTDRLEIAAALLDQRDVLPTLHRQVNALELAALAEHEVLMVFAKAMARDDRHLLALLLRFRPDETQWPTASPAFKAPIAAAAWESLAFLYIHAPWFTHPCILDDAAATGNLAHVQQLHQGGASCSRKAMILAAARGHLDIVAFLHTHRWEGCDVLAMDYAAAHGHAHVVSFLHWYRTEGCTTEAMDLAAGNGHLEVVGFLHHHRREGCTVKALDAAIANGHDTVVRFLVEHRTEGASPNALDVAVEKGHTDIVAFLLGRDAFLPSTREHVVRIAVENGHVRTAELLLSLGYPFPTTCDLTAAIQTPDAIDLLALTTTHGLPWQASWMDAACTTDRLDLVDYLHTHSVAGCTTLALENAIQHRAWTVVAFLLAHRTEGGGLEAVRYALQHGAFDVVDQLWARRPWLRDNSLLETAIEASPAATAFVLAAGLGDIKHSLLRISSLPFCVTESKLLLQHVVHTTTSIDHLVAILVELYAAPLRPIKPVLDVLAAELVRHVRLSLCDLRRVPCIDARAAVLLQQGAIVEWAFALGVAHVWSLDASVVAAWTGDWLAVVHDAELTGLLRALTTSTL
ncbi:hypothetical protein SPRG_06449 [Saprolegnia parasitica CBS 223.65]|uniref:Uncharacterized protein n=1 Tax=Saprolegnia parasitica (strain CBS 223.65) TaxID=695850 RepID=A0A067CDM1_SAPPC|nr:hypothetical protein SPRG_06449 [Saprolegnia parasitica CBS 223.65]KDO28593.1 hypothetical protein SPRG_06449 [Saprolegnia parasitica CBS 223.65]|eukprot:XP_012200656.1 hypothetical protein SPRG_06449 [Saprolegnia parasitica CBS 223.65]